MNLKVTLKSTFFFFFNTVSVLCLEKHVYHEIQFPGFDLFETLHPLPTLLQCENGWRIIACP